MFLKEKKLTYLYFLCSSLGFKNQFEILLGFFFFFFFFANLPFFNQDFDDKQEEARD